MHMKEALVCVVICENLQFNKIPRKFGHTFEDPWPFEFCHSLTLPLFHSQTLPVFTSLFTHLRFPVLFSSLL